MSTRTRRQHFKPYLLPKLQRHPTRTLTLYLNMELHFQNENVLMVLLILFLQLIFKLLMIYLLLFRWWKLIAGLGRYGVIELECFTRNKNTPFSASEYQFNLILRKWSLVWQA